jgi:hypothetical protein
MHARLRLRLAAAASFLLGCGTPDFTPNGPDGGSSLRESDAGRDPGAASAPCGPETALNACGGCEPLGVTLETPCSHSATAPEWACPSPVWQCSPHDPNTAICDWRERSVEICDGLDNDCDGFIDEDFDLLNDPEHCGACDNVCVVHNGIPGCVDGQCVIVACTPGWANEDGLVETGCEAVCVPDGSPLDHCDGRDNDCDGLVDEDFLPTPCGVGACASESRCIDGVIHPCVPLEPLVSEELHCDGIDENCDGVVDEGISLPCANACGGGERMCRNGDFPACAATNEAGEICIDIDYFCETVPIELELALPRPDNGIGVDLVFLFDRSGSFLNDLSMFRAKAAELTAALSAELPDLRVGLASFIDAPCASFGSPGDFGYELNLALTYDLEALQSALAEIDIRGGSDLPESQLEAMYQAITGAGVVAMDSAYEACRNGVADIPPSDMGWQENRLRYLFVSTDATFHRPTDFGYPYPTDVDDVIEAALEHEIAIYLLQAGGALDPDAHRLTTSTGGRVFTLSSDSREIVEAVTAAIVDTLTHARVELVPDGDYLGFVTDVTPRALQGVDLMTNTHVRTTVTLLSTLGPSGVEQEYAFDLVFLVNGTEVDRRPVTVTIPAEDPKACNNRPPIVRSLDVPRTIQTGGTTTVAVNATEPDDDPMEYQWSASAGAFRDPFASSSRFTAPVEPGLVHFEVVVFDSEGLSDRAEATTLVLGGSCGSEPYVLDLGLTEGRLVLDGELTQRQSTSPCGGSGAEAVVHVRVRRGGTYRFAVENSGTWFLHMRERDCSTEHSCGAGLLANRLDPGDYLLFIDSAQGEIGGRFQLSAEPL